MLFRTFNDIRFTIWKMPARRASLTLAGLTLYLIKPASQAPRFDRFDPSLAQDQHAAIQPLCQTHSRIMPYSTISGLESVPILACNAGLKHCTTSHVVQVDTQIILLTSLQRTQDPRARSGTPARGLALLYQSISRSSYPNFSLRIRTGIAVALRSADGFREDRQCRCIR
jgi:hypothetical protein